MQPDQTNLELLNDVEGGASSPLPAAAPAAPKLSKAQVKTIKQRMQVAEKYYETKFKPWFEEVERLWRGEHYTGPDSEDDHRAVLNILPHVVDTKVYSTTFNHPEIIVKPQDRLGHDNLAVAEKVTHCEYRQSHAHRETRRAFKDAEKFNFGVLMTGWEWETDDVHFTDGRGTIEGETPEPEAVLKAVETGQDLPPPTPRARVRKDNFYVRRLDPRSFRISPEASWVIGDAPYCGYVEWVDVADLKADPRYKHTRGLKGTSDHLDGFRTAPAGDEAEEAKTELAADLKRVKLHHYYSKRQRLHVVVSDESDQPHLVEKWHWEHDEYPFLPIFSEPSEDGWYSKPPPLQWKTCQQELNHFHTQLAIHIRRFTRRYVARTGSFDPQELEKLERGVDGTVLFTNEDPTTALNPVQDAQMTPDAYAMEKMAFQYASLISGVDQYSMGRAPTKRMTQDEVQTIQQAGGARQQGSRAAYEQLCADVARHCLAYNQQYAQRTRSYPVEVDGQIAEWIDWTYEQIKGQYSFEVYVGSTEIKNKAGQLEEIGFLLQALTPFFQMPDPMTGAPLANAKPLLRQLLAAVPEIKDVAAIVPADEAAMDPEMEALMAEGGDPLGELAGMMGGPAPMGLDGQVPPALPPGAAPEMGAY